MMSNFIRNLTIVSAFSLCGCSGKVEYEEVDESPNGSGGEALVQDGEGGEGENAAPSMDEASDKCEDFCEKASKCYCFPPGNNLDEFGAYQWELECERARSSCVPECEYSLSKEASCSEQFLPYIDCARGTANLCETNYFEDALIKHCSEEMNVVETCSGD